MNTRQVKMLVTVTVAGDEVTDEDVAAEVLAELNDGMVHSNDWHDTFLTTDVWVELELVKEPK